MTIHLVSNDRELYKLCHDLIAEVPDPPASWRLVLISGEEEWREADLHIWDFHPDIRIPSDVRDNPLRHLFLVDRKHLSVFWERTGAGEGNVLLKPITRATLATYLAPALSRGAAKSLRADRDELFQCVIQANLKLQEYDQDRTAFLARAVHDFRAPLTAVRGYCGLLLSESLGSLNETQIEVLSRMRNSANRLSRMASAMFELSVARQVKRSPEVQVGNIRECIDQALYEIAPFAEEKYISITADMEPCGSYLYFEPGQIVQVLINILDNACKFTPRGGSIAIRGYPFFWERRAHNPGELFAPERRSRNDRAANAYRVDISDSGATIPGERLQRIFEEYTSYGGGRDRSGGGLGLAICKMIMTQHNGFICAENRRSGPVFSFFLPVSAGGADAGHGQRNSGFVGVTHAGR